MSLRLTTLAGLAVVALVLLTALLYYVGRSSPQVPEWGTDVADSRAVESSELRRASPQAGARRPDGEALRPLEPRPLWLLVEDSSGAPISGAVAFALGGPGAASRLGRTADDGRLELSHDDLICERLVVRRADYVQADLELPDELPEEIRVVLQLGVSIEGRVVRSDGIRPEEGTLVVAIPEYRIPQVAGLEALLVEGVDVARAEIRPGGGFLIGGLEPGRRYELAAGSLGWVTSERVEALAGDAGVELQVFATYGVRVHLREEEGQALQTTPSFHYTDHFATRFLDPMAMVPLQHSLELSLAGLDPRELEHRAGESVFFLTAPEDRERLLSMGVHVNVPGYYTLDSAVPVPRCLGQIEIHELQLQRSTEAWTELTLEVLGGPSEWGEATGGFRPELKLTFVDHGGQVGVLAFSPGVSHHRVPVGEYEFELGVEVSGWRSEVRDQRRVRLIGPEDRVSFDFPAGLGALEIDLSDREGWTARGQATLFYRRAGGAGGFRVQNFIKAPYRLAAFPAGEWEVFATTGLSMPTSGSEQYTQVSVQEGELASISLQAM